jgi:diguanylate cyclase (GGDEF)-like protein/PAS domain S-box-containing protein
MFHADNTLRSHQMSDFDDAKLYRSILDSLQTGVYLVDREQKILFWNDGAERITGHLRQDVVGRSSRCDMLARGEGNTCFVSDAGEAIVAVLRDGKPAVVNVSLRHKDGHRVLVRMRAVPIRNGHGSVIGAAESFEESIAVSNWDRRKKKLGAFGFLDPATEVPTEAYIQSHLREQIVTFGICPIPFSVMSIQVDQTDEVRAKYGPRAVVAILRAVGQTLENSLRPTDLLGLGTRNQFVVILSECPAAEVEKVAERLKRTVPYAEIKWWGEDLSVTASFGGATVKPGDTVESLIERAEKSLLDGIAAGGNFVLAVAD